MNTPVQYDGFASVADEYWRSFGPEFSELILPRIDRLIRSQRLQAKTLLDLGCGTGSFAIQMAGRGLQVTGLDASCGALEVARRKAGRAKARVQWILGDMRSFTTDQKFDLVTSVFNSVNHLLSTRDLGAMFGAVSRALVPGGHFIFDLNHRSCFEQVWGGLSVVRRPRFFLIRCDEIDRRRRRATAHLVIFLKRGNRYIQIKDSIQERWFREAEIRERARRANLRIVHKEDFNPFSKGLGYSKRIKSLWILERGD
ncbi:MAG: class I SAM-dependent methyltransferase [Terriglobia bacterium]